MTINRFKEALAAKRRQIGVWSSLGSPVAAQLMAGAGFDWMLIDCEHSPIDPADLVPLLQATVTGTAEPVVRPPWNDPVMIKRTLDVGARNLLVPFVQNGDEARAAVSASRYPPAGIRGVAGATRASSFGRDKGYHARANENICVIAQVETQEALGNIAAIGAVEGIDGVFVGPSDLAASMGHIGEPGHADVQAAIADAFAAIRATGKAAGILATSPEDAERYLAIGFDFIAIGSDVGLLVRAADALAQRFVERTD